MLQGRPVTPTLPAEDIGRARAFYEEKLGLTPLKSTEGDVMFECGGGTMLYIYERGPSVAEHTEAVFQVDDVESEINDLESRGVVFEDYDMPDVKTDEKHMATQDGYHTAWFKDTEGNIIGITDMKM